MPGLFLKESSLKEFSIVLLLLLLLFLHFFCFPQFGTQPIGFGCHFGIKILKRMFFIIQDIKYIIILSVNFMQVSNIYLKFSTSVPKLNGVRNKKCFKIMQIMLNMQIYKKKKKNLKRLFWPMIPYKCINYQMPGFIHCFLKK